MTIHLQGIYGNVNAIKVADLKPGDVVTWNYGYKSKVVSLEKSKSGKTVIAMMMSLQDGIVRERRMSVNKLVAVG